MVGAERESNTASKGAIKNCRLLLSWAPSDSDAKGRDPLVSQPLSLQVPLPCLR